MSLISQIRRQINCLSFNRLHFLLSFVSNYKMFVARNFFRLFCYSQKLTSLKPSSTPELFSLLESRRQNSPEIFGYIHKFPAIFGSPVSAHWGKNACTKVHKNGLMREKKWWWWWWRRLKVHKNGLILFNSIQEINQPLETMARLMFRIILKYSVAGHLVFGHHT